MRVPRFSPAALRCLTALLAVAGLPVVVSVAPSTTTSNTLNVSISIGSSSSGHDVSVGDIDPSDGTIFASEPAVSAHLTVDANALPEWLKSSPVLGALTPSAHSIRGNGDKLVDGVVIQIAPRFAVTSSSLLSERGLAQLRNASLASRSVVFQGGAVQVTRVLFESDFYGPGDYPLVVLELRDEPTSARPARVLTANPNKGFGYEQLRILHVTSRQVKNKESQESKLAFFVESLCGLTPPSDEDDWSVTELCVGRLNKPTGKLDFDAGDAWHHQRDLAPLRPIELGLNHSVLISPTTPRPVGVRHPHGKNVTDGATGRVPRPGRQDRQLSPPSLLFYGDDLLGLSIPASMADKSVLESFHDATRKSGFLRLAAPEHSAFLDAATNKTTSYNDDDVFSKLSKYPSYLTTFLDAAGRKTPCQGVLIAPQFVLTTASCLQAHNDTSAVQFYSSDASKRREPVKVLRTAFHPRYTAGDVTFDTAVVALERAVAVAPIQLDDGSVNQNASLARIQVADDDQCMISATVPMPPIDFHDSSDDDDDDGFCRSANGHKLRQFEAFCMRPIAPADAGFAFHVGSFVGDDALAIVDVVQPSASMGAALVTLTRQSSVALVGLAVPSSLSSSSSSRERQLNLEAAQNPNTGEVYVRVANSATFINAYVAGTSWSNREIAMEVAPEIEMIQLPQDKHFIVGLRTTKDGQNYCGGSLIAPTIVLTAAHCVVDAPPKFVSIGAYDSSGTDAEVIAVLPDKTQRHSQYGKPHAFSFDVAILELAFAASAAPVWLDNTVDFIHRESATMFGYGMSSAASGLSPTLRAVQMPLWSRSACRQAFGDEVDDSMLCAGGEKGRDACTGDSGSPLVVTRDGKNVLVGVVSAGAGCGVANVPGVYARIHRVRDFIRALVIGATWSKSDSDGGYNVTRAPGATVSPAQDTASSIEAREGTSSPPPTQPPSANANAQTSAPVTGPYKAAKLPLADWSPLVRESFMDFLLGSDAAAGMVDTTMLRAMKATQNTLQLYSTSELSELLAVVSRHNQLPLNRRNDRFDRWKDAYASVASHGC